MSVSFPKFGNIQRKPNPQATRPKFGDAPKLEDVLSVDKDGYLVINAKGVKIQNSEDSTPQGVVKMQVDAEGGLRVDATSMGLVNRGGRYTSALRQADDIGGFVATYASNGRIQTLMGGGENTDNLGRTTHNGMVATYFTNMNSNNATMATAMSSDGRNGYARTFNQNGQAIVALDVDDFGGGKVETRREDGITSFLAGANQLGNGIAQVHNMKGNCTGYLAADEATDSGELGVGNSAGVGETFNKNTLDSLRTEIKSWVSQYLSQVLKPRG